MLRCAASKKEPKKSVGTLVRGDNESEVIRIEIARNIEGVDLSDFVWSVKYTNSVGQTDIDVLEVEEVNSHDIILLWTPGGAATSEPGITSFEIEGIDGERVWQSATQYIELLDDLDGEPNYDPEEMSEVQRLIRFTKDEINALYSASEAASAAAVAADSAASKADAAAERANEAATSSDHGRVVALEKFTFDPEPYAHTGDIVQFDNYENMPMNVVTHIEPVQSGSGDPYPGGGGKNLQPNDATTKTQNGVTFTGNHDGTVTVNGTATSDIYYNLPAPHVTVGETYILTGCPAGGGSGTYRLYHKYRDSGGNYANDYGDGVTFTEENGTYVTTIFIASGQTVSNLVFKPMIRLASDDDATYAPYSNIRPITGHTEDVLTRRGKNLIPSMYADTRTVNGIVFTKNADGVVAVDGTSTGYASTSGDYINAVSLRGKTLTCKGASAPGIAVAQLLIQCDSGNVYKSCTGDNENALTFVIPDDANTMRWEIYVPANKTVSGLNVYPQLELGSTATAYEPYNGETFTADFGQTVYGGTLDWNTGVLTVDKKMVAFDGSEGWFLQNTNSAGILRWGLDIAETKITDNSATVADFVSSHYKTISANGTFLRNNGISHHNHRVHIFDDRYSTKTLADFTGYLAEQYAAGTPVQVCYKLAEPITIQLTPQEILALGGVNTLYAEAGDITVSGRKDILYLTDYLLNKLKSLENTN